MSVTSPAPLRAILFDFAGTLFDDLGVLRPAAVVARAQDLGIALDGAAAAVLIARTMRYINAPEHVGVKVGADLSVEAHRRVWTGLIADSEPGSDRLADVLYDALVDNDAWHPYPDAAAVVAQLRARAIRVGVLSNIGWDIRPAIARLIDPGLLDALILSFEVGLEKPDPAIFTLACERMGTAPAETLFVGDDPAKDGFAVRAGLPVYLLPSERDGARPRGLGAVLRLFEDGEPSAR